MYNPSLSGGPDLRDGFGRTFPYLRLSITDVCNFKCEYCLPNGYQGRRSKFLEQDEIMRLVDAFADMGTYKVRLTGGEPTVRKDFADIARACEAGRDDLAGRGVSEDGNRRLRKFSTWEITRYLIPVAQAHFRRVLKQNPDLPQGQSETTGGAKWFTLDEVHRLRAFFGDQGSKAKEYVPYRPAGLAAKLVAVANFKGGVGKTSTAAHLAMSAALDGYKVLVIDLDSQASMTSVFGGTVADEWQTVFPLLARHYAAHLQSSNQGRVDCGEAPIPLDDTLTEALEVKTQSLIQPHQHLRPKPAGERRTRGGGKIANGAQPQTLQGNGAVLSKPQGGNRQWRKHAQYILRRRDPFTIMRKRPGRPARGAKTNLHRQPRPRQTAAHVGNHRLL